MSEFLCTVTREGRRERERERERAVTSAEARNKIAPKRRTTGTAKVEGEREREREMLRDPHALLTKTLTQSIVGQGGPRRWLSGLVV